MIFEGMSASIFPEHAEILLNKFWVISGIFLETFIMFALDF